MAAYHKVEVSLNTNAVEVGIPSPQTVNVVVPTIGPAGPTGSVGPVGPTGPQGVPGTGLEVLTTQGDILYQGASTGQRLPIGTSGQVLKVANGIPAWGNESGAVTSVNGETGTVILDGSEIDSSANDVRAAFTAGAFSDGNGIYYPLPDTFLNTKPVYKTTSGYSVFFENARWHIADGSPITANIIESSDDDNAAFPWQSAWSGDVDKAKIADVIGRARDTFLFVGDNVPSTSVSGLGTAATADSTAFAAASHKASHATGGTDALAPSDIGAQSLFTSSNETVSADVTLSSARAARVRLENYDGATYNVTLPTTDVRVGDVFIFTTGTLVGAQTIRRENFGGNFTTLATISEGQSYRIISIGTASGSWQIDPVFTHTHVVAEVTGAAASGSITTSGLTQASARILGRTTASTGAVEEIQIGSGLSLSAGELSSTVSAGIPATLLDAKGDLIVASAADTAARLAVGGTNGHVLTVDSAEATGMAWKAASGGITAVGTSTADVLSVSGSDLVADDGGLINSANPAVVWDDVAGKLVYANPLARPSGAGSMFIGLAPSTTALGTNAINIQTARSNANQVASATESICIGLNARATGNQSIRIGKDGLSDFDNSIAIGNAAQTSGPNTVAIGDSVNGNLRGCFFTRPFNSVYWGGQTTNATATIIGLDAGGSTVRFNIPANTALAVDILLVARRSDTQDKWLVARRFLGIRRDGSNNTSLIGSVEVLSDQSSGSPSWTFALTADDTNEALQLEVTGAASETVQWRATAFYRVV
jgi:hypothetical protein